MVIESIDLRTIIRYAFVMNICYVGSIEVNAGRE